MLNAAQLSASCLKYRQKPKYRIRELKSGSPGCVWQPWLVSWIKLRKFQGWPQPLSGSDMSHRMIITTACTSGQPRGQGGDFVLKDTSSSLIKLIVECIQKYNRNNTKIVEIKLKRWRFDAKKFLLLRRFLKCMHTILGLLATFSLSQLLKCRSH